MESKVCACCGEDKPTTEFYKRKESKDGLTRLCRTCDFNRLKAYRESPEGKAKEQDRQYRKNFGITLKQFEDMKAAQNNCCAGCGIKGEDAPRGTLYVDHCHDTNIVRGLLCQNCNFAIGLLKDNTSTLSNLISYLERAYG